MGKGRQPSRRTHWAEVPRENKDWEAFYRAQDLLSPAEFEDFKAACTRDLPLTFRITGTSRHALANRHTLEEAHIKALQGQEWEGQPLEAPKPLPFYSDRLAWEIRVPKQAIRKNPQFAGLQRFLVVETAVGNVSRQEAVSMLPPLFLDVQPDHAVLDTCASPGSKTVQLLEALHKDSTGAVPGLVIANDSDYKRSHMLTHQVKRLNSPNIVITNVDAQRFPNLWLDAEHTRALKFDRILCDVPCTGDGTMRKNINVWRDWTPGNALGLHTLQVNITLRSIQMLKPGGRLVYSTCSLNPVEDEAVVAQILRLNPDVHLVDVSDQLPGLIRSPGVSSWKVMGKDKEWHTEPDPDPRKKLDRSVFPPDHDESFNLERTMRVFPHQQDTGGFFIAVFEKDFSEQPATKRARRAPKARVASSAPEDESVGDVDSAANGASKCTKDADVEAGNASDDKSHSGSEKEVKPVKLPRDVPQTEDPFRFLPPDHPEIQACWDFYGVTDQKLRDSLVVRNAMSSPSRTIYFVAPVIRPILEFNEGRIRLINAGIKLFNFQKTEGPCNWRVQSEGIELLFPYSTKRVVTTNNMDTLKLLLLESFPKLSEIRDADSELYEQVQPLGEGCCMWKLNGFVYPLWRGRASLNLMTPKEVSAELLLRLFGIEKPKLQKQVENKQDKTEGPKDEEKECL